MPAVKHFSYMKGPGAKHPCRSCMIQGIYHRTRRKYYLPMQVLKDNEEPIDRQNYSRVNLELRTTDGLWDQICKIRAATTSKLREELSKEYGVSGASILLHVPGFNPVLSYPHECMHLLFENIVPMLIYLWKGKF